MRNETATALLVGILLVAGIIGVGELLRVTLVEPYFPQAAVMPVDTTGSTLVLAPMSAQLMLVVGILFGACAILAVSGLLFAEYTDPYHGDQPA